MVTIAPFGNVYNFKRRASNKLFEAPMLFPKN